MLAEKGKNGQIVYNTTYYIVGRYKDEKKGCYPTVILRLCCGYHLVRYRYGIENGVETGREWGEAGTVRIGRIGRMRMPE